MLNTDYSIYNGYDTLFGSLGATSAQSVNNPMSDLLVKITDFNKSYGYSTNKSGYVTSDVQKYLGDIKSDADKLKSAFTSLFGTDKSKTSVFQEKALVSSDKDAVSVQTSSAYKRDIESVKIQVDQVAESQKNSGKALASSGKNFSTGWNQFEIEIGGKTHQISFNVSASDDNAAVLNKIAEAVNTKDIGIKASVETDNGKKTSTLSLEGVTTGIDAKTSFVVRDHANGGGGAAGIAGVDITTRSAQNALYRIDNGEQLESKSNSVTITEGVTATLKKATSEPVTIKPDYDTTGSINKVREMVNGFNGLMAASDDNKSDRGGYRLYNQLQGLSSAYGASLSRIGINVQSNGYLSIDEDKMKEAAENGNLEKFFTQNGIGSNFGFANRLSQIADNVSRNPTDFIGRDKIQNSPTAGNSEMFSYLQTYRYNSIINTGLLFDYFF